jgi:hypothetical protein
MWTDLIENMKTLINVTENNWFEEIMQAVRFIYTGHTLDGFPRDGHSLILERENEPVKYVTGLRWKDNNLTGFQKNDITNILVGYINQKEDILGGRLYTNLFFTDKIYINIDNT